MTTNFEWDEAKAERNERKHKVAFEEAKTVFDDSLSLTIPDPDHSETEDRFIDIGMSVNGRVLIVVYVERGENIRIISSRKANKRERKQYAEES